ncbi:MAG: hypothetical protein V3U08_08875, partial [Nitrospirales bacterium]
IRGCDKPACEVGGKKPLRRDLIERGGSSEAWYGGRARHSVPQRTVPVRLGPSRLHAPVSLRDSRVPVALLLQRVERDEPS